MYIYKFPLVKEKKKRDKKNSEPYLSAARRYILNVQVSTLFFSFFHLPTIFFQVSTALATLDWYKQKFPDFPANRKAIFPFIL
jgi:hypothetical protein